MAKRKNSTAPGAADKGSRRPNASTLGWQSVAASNARRYLFTGPAQDFRRDLTPYDRDTQVRKCRWAERNSGLFRQVVGDTVLYSVGDGIVGQSHADSDSNARLYEEYFLEKCQRLDVTNRFNFYQIQRLSLRAMIRDGDSFAAKVRNGSGDAKLQLFEAHKVGDPKNVPVPDRMWDGVQFGPYGEILGYNVYRSDDSSRFIYSSSMMHIVDLENSSASRGYPLLQHSINSIQDEMEILALEKVAVKDNSDVTRVIKKTGGFIDGDMASELGGRNDGLGYLASQMGGKLIALEPGEDFQSFSSNRPNPTFSGFLAALERDVTMGILPYEFVSDPSRIGGASVRLVTAKAARVFGKYQNILIESLCRPTWAYIIGDGIAKGELPDDPNWFLTPWTTPKSVTVDAGREAAQDRADVEMGLMSMSELYAQRGLDFRSEMAKRAQDMAHIASLAKEYGIPFELLFRPTNAQPGTIAATTPPSRPAPTPGEIREAEEEDQEEDENEIS